MVPGDDLQLAQGQGLRDEQGVLVPDHVPGARDDQGGDAEAFQPGGVDMGLVDHEAQELGVSLGLRAFLRKEGGELVPQHDGELNGGLHPGGVQVGPVEDQPPDPLRVVQGEGQGSIPAVAEAQEVRPVQGVGVHEVQQVEGKLGDGEGCIAPGGLPVAPGVNGVDGTTSTEETSTIEETTSMEETSTIEEETSSIEETSNIPTEGTYTISESDMTMYTVKGCNIRQGASTEYDVIGTLSKGEAVKITGKVNEVNWYEISLSEDKKGYVSGSLLVSEKPAEEQVPSQPEQPAQPQQPEQPAQPPQQPAQPEQPASSDAMVNPNTGEAMKPGESYIAPNGVKVTYMTDDILFNSMP